jgi:hypothetical protein
MLGLDKKALRKLEKLEGLPEGHVGGRHSTILASLGEWYRNPEFRFFTSSQRRMVDEIHSIYMDPPSRKENILLDLAEENAKDELASESEKEITLSILGRHGRNIRAFSKKELAFIKGLSKKIVERQKQKKVREELEGAADRGEIRSGAESFCRSIIRQFDERKQWTAIQMEHAEKILAGNEDPLDGDD